MSLSAAKQPPVAVTDHSSERIVDHVVRFAEANAQEILRRLSECGERRRDQQDAPKPPQPLRTPGQHKAEGDEQEDVHITLPADIRLIEAGVGPERGEVDLRDGVESLGAYSNRNQSASNCEINDPHRVFGENKKALRE